MNAVNAQPLQRTDEWLAQRKGRITASRVGAILGLSKYRTRADVLREMVREWHGAEREFTGNEATRYGEAHEADAIGAYEQRYGTLVMPAPLVVHPLHDWLAASPDGWVGDDGALEVKCPYRATYTEASAEYQAQMQLQRACDGRLWTDFAVWRGGEPLVVTRYPREDGWLERNFAALGAFAAEFSNIAASDELSAPYLAAMERNDAEWREAVAAWQHANAEAASYAELADAARKRLVDLAPQGAKGCGVQVVKIERAGTIRYADALKSMLPDVDLSPWRGKPSVSYQVRESKE